MNIRWMPLVLFLLVPNLLMADEGPVYRIATVMWAGWSPLQVAEANGFWKKIGVNVEVVIYNDPVVVLEAMKANKIDFAMDMIGSLLGVYMEGVPILILAETDWSHGGDKIIVKRGESIAQHKGDPLGVFLKLPSCLFFLDRYLQTQGLSVSDFRIVEIQSDDLAELFIADRIPVIVNYDPYALKALEEGNGQILASSAMYEGCIPEGIWGFENRIRQFPKKDVVGILKGWIRAASWVNDPDNWSEYQKILLERTFKDNDYLSADDLRRLVDAVKIHTPYELLERNKDNGGLQDYFHDLRVFLDSNNLLTKDFKSNDIFDNTFVLEALKMNLDEPAVNKTETLKSRQ